MAQVFNPATVMAALQGVGQSMSGQPRNFLEGFGMGLSGSTGGLLQMQQLAAQNRRQAAADELARQKFDLQKRQFANTQEQQDFLNKVKEQTLAIQQSQENRAQIEANRVPFSTIVTDSRQAASFGLNYDPTMGPIEIKGYQQGRDGPITIENIESVGRGQSFGEALAEQQMQNKISELEKSTGLLPGEELMKKNTGPRLLDIQKKRDVQKELMFSNEMMREALLRGADTGPMAPTVQELRRFASRLDLASPEDIKTMEATTLFDAISSYMVPRVRPEGSGQTSDFEFKTFMKAIPGMRKTRQGNLAILNAQDALARRKLAEFDFQDEYALRKGHLIGVEKAMREGDESIGMAALPPVEFGLPRVMNDEDLAGVEPGEYYIRGEGRDAEFLQKPAAGTPQALSRSEALKILQNPDSSFDDIMKAGTALGGS